MTQDFFTRTQETSRNLNATNRDLFDYVVKNLNAVMHMSIQKFAQTKFVSTTTIFRFAQRLGFAGYSDFINCLLITAHSKPEASLPGTILSASYSESYLQNAMETVRAMSPEDMGKISQLLATRPNVYILTDDNTYPIAQYSEKLFIGLGLRAYAPEATYQMQTLVNHISDNDMLIALSYSGQDTGMIDFIERTYLNAKPFLMSITRADNNKLESLSDVNFYIFAEEVRFGGMEMTSCMPMLMVLEMLVYGCLGGGE